MPTGLAQDVPATLATSAADHDPSQGVADTTFINWAKRTLKRG